ncbi:Suppressor of tumorigenicity 14 protein-like [Holothuria leucospilota]|uniref:Suppressor of tumorigenicity 14 protein-like n=1 Tax=Holothuria leucospilota TaxID=206669 RepID=A0A9Q1CRC5_HOLLE|nr:Suppressor of tumorigenicity 14 protein-like [Holothuria leucospilota]
MEIHYTSQSGKTVGGFEALVEFLDPDSDYRAPGPVICESIYLETNGSVNVRSPTFPNTQYRNIRCGYVIHADIGEVISMKIVNIFMEDCLSRAYNEDFLSMPFSSYDIPEAFDGANRQAPPITDRLCGFNATAVTFVSSGNIIYLYYETDEDRRHGGFEVSTSMFNKVISVVDLKSP